MNNLKAIVDAVIIRQKAELSPSTFDVRRRYLIHLVEHAENIGIETPCQALYDSYVSRSNTPDTRFQLFHAVRLVDKAADTRAFTPEGSLYNEPELPSEDAAISAFAEISFPLKDGSIDTGYLIRLSAIKMKYLCHSESTFGQYIKAWREFYCYLYAVIRDTVFSRKNADKFLRTRDDKLKSGTIKKWKWKIYRRSILVLLEVANTGKFEWKMFRSNQVRCKDDTIEELRLHYLSYLKTMNLENNTIDLHDYVFRNIIEELAVSDVHELETITPGHIQGMLTGFSGRLCANSCGTVYPIIRKILVYLHGSGFIKKDFSGMVLTPAYRQMHLRPYMTASDENKVFKVLDNSPLRNKAMMCLALRLGLRDMDICNLQFDQIDWRNDRIVIEQEKTGISLSLPLLEDVGNAIMDYIVNERPATLTGYPYVFVRRQAPFTKISSMYKICSKTLDAADVDVVNRKSRGVHVCRYTLTHKLLKAKVPHQVITDTLGHISKESDKPYLSMEESMLRECPLDFSIIGQKYWEEGDTND